MSLTLRLDTPQALEHAWQHEVSRGRIRVLVEGASPAPGEEVPVRIVIVGVPEPIDTVFLAAEVSPGPCGAPEAAGWLREFERVERAVVEAMGRCPLLGRLVLLASERDEPVTRFVGPLRREGARVAVVGDGHLAWEILAREPLYLGAAILDRDLPGRSGPELAWDLERAGRGRDLPFVLLGGDALTGTLPGNVVRFPADPEPRQVIARLVGLA